jgi:PAS domain S-box-containing protein
LHAGSDAIIGLAYFSIPLALSVFVWRRKDLKILWPIYLFIGFILACGATHLFSILTLWVPVYGLEGLVKAVTAVLSVATAIALWPLLPLALALPSPIALRTANERLALTIEDLEQRVAERTGALEESNSELHSIVEQREKLIDELRRQQQALNESEETFRTALENAVVGNALVATNGRWLKVNRALCTLLGFEEADLLRDGDALIQHPDDPWAVRETVEDLMSGASSVVERERFLRHRDGHQLWVKVCASMVTRGDGATDYLMVQFQDLTERKRAEIIKDEFVSTVNHELRTPLTSIFGSLRLLGATTAGKLDRKAERLLEVAQISCNQLTGLVNDILDIEKIAAGKMDYHLETLPAGPLIRDIIKRHSAIADDHGVRFNTRLELDGLALRVDPNRFNQALVNLLSNAAKYSPSGGKVEIVAKREGDAAIRISVTDHGPGIPHAFRPTIFGRFAQADTSTTRKVGGSGLGLNITKTLIEAFGGTVAFDSVEGQGATFHFVLPCYEVMATQLELQSHG